MSKPLPNASDFLPGPMLLLGAPGVGKGTQAKRLMEEFGIPQISTGDILRAIKSDPAKANTPVGSKAKALMDIGSLVPDDIVNSLVANRLKEPDTEHGYILDGFPRTLIQAEWLDRQLVAYQLPVVAINIIVPQKVLLERITGRRISPSGRIYNVYTNPPKVEGVDDVDGSKLEQRVDDTEEVFQKRMSEFRDNTAAVIEYYREHGGRFAEVNGDQDIDQVTRDIRSTLLNLRHHPEA
jgi:adenylate kinase